MVVEWWEGKVGEEWRYGLYGLYGVWDGGREEGGDGVAVGDRVGWKSWSDDIPYGAVGTVTGFETDGPSGGQRTVILFDGGVGSFSIETDDGEWCGKLSGLGVWLGWVDFQAINDFRRLPTN